MGALVAVRPNAGSIAAKEPRRGQPQVSWPAMNEGCLGTCRRAGSRWRRVSASAGARYLKVRRHLALLGPRRRGEHARSTRGAPSARPNPPCARPSHPSRPTHGSRTFPPPCTAHAPPCTPRFHLTPFCPCVRGGSILPFYLDQGRGRRAEAARRRRRGPCGPGGRLGAQGGAKRVVSGAPRCLFGTSNAWCRARKNG